MKVKDFLHEVSYNLQPNDEIVVMWFTKEYATNNIPESLLQDKEIVEQAWRDIVDEGQETLDAHIDFTQTGYDLSELLETRIKELLKKENENE